MAHKYYLRKTIGTPDDTLKPVYRYKLVTGTGVGYTISRLKDRVQFYDTQPQARKELRKLPKEGWHVAIYKPRTTPGLSKLSKPYTTTCRKYLGASSMVYEILRAEGKKVLAEVVKREILAAVARRKQQYEKKRAALLKELENGRPN